MKTFSAKKLVNAKPTTAKTHNFLLTEPPEPDRSSNFVISIFYRPLQR
jgi:hypothetical protein